MSLILALMLQASVAAPSTANCTGARQGEVCTEEGRAALRAALDVKPLQAETADGVEVYRAFYLEGGEAYLPSPLSDVPVTARRWKCRLEPTTR